MLRAITLLSLLLLTIGYGRAQFSAVELEAKVDALMSGNVDAHGPGSAIVVVQDGKVILNKGYGLADLSQQIPIDPNTVFDLASVSKQFAGFAIASLVEEGRIQLTDDVRKYIPELPDFETTITIDHLLHHTSGIRDWTNTLPLAGWSFDDVISFEQILRMAFRQQALNFVPGSAYSYSNTGYNLLAEVVQRVSGLSFRDWTEQHIFQPLGMTNSRFLDDYTELIPHRASGYYLDQSGEYHVATNNLMALGSSSLFSSTSDLAKWVMNLDQPSAEMAPMVARMQQTTKLNDGKDNNYAFGLSMGNFHGTPSMNHSGSWASFRTYLLVLPEKHLGIVVLNNYASNPNATASTIASWYVPEPEHSGMSTSTTPSAPVKVPVATLDRYTGTYRLGPGWYVSITRQDDQLWTQATHEDNFPMTALSNNLFRVDAYGGRTMEFFAAANARATHLVYSGMECPLMEKTAAPEPSQLQAYTGRYTSEELQTTYEVVVEDNELKLRHFRHGDLDLRHASGEDFTGSRWFIGSVEFFRDATGKVQGFLVSSSRAGNQRFVKEAP